MREAACRAIHAGAARRKAWTVRTHVSRNVATARRPGRPIPAAMGTAGWAQAEAARALIRTVLRAPPDWRAPATRSVPTSTTMHGAPIAAPAGQSLTRPAKLEIGAVDDPLEHEADRIAAQVMHMPATEPAPTSAPVQINRKCTACEEEEKLQKKSTETADVGVSGALDSVPEVLRSSGEPLDDATRAFMEPRFGRDFGNVRVHTGGTASKSASAIGAAAYTVGPHIVFGAGNYAPQTAHGRRLLAHELTHTVQQGNATSPHAGPVGAIHTGARGHVQMVGECDGRPYGKCGGQRCVHASGRAGSCAWSGAIKTGCICIPVDSPIRAAEIMAGLAALVIFAAIFFPPAGLAALLEGLLGALARWLAFGLIAGGAAVASADTGDASTDQPAGDPVPTAKTTVPPAGTTPVPGGTTVPPTGTSPPPSRTTVPPARPEQRKKPPLADVPPLKAKTIKMKLIEGVNLETVVVGKSSWVINYRTKEVMLLQVTGKESQEKETTVTFVSLVECSPDGRCSQGGNVYIVTHPYRPSDATADVGRASAQR